MGSPYRCIVELLIGLGGFGGLATLIAAIWGIVRYYDKKKTDREQVLANQEKERTQLLQSMSKQLNEVVRTNKELRTEVGTIQKDVSELKKQLKAVQKEAQNTQKTIEENEMDRLRSDIILYQNQLENGMGLNQQALMHIHHCYDKYTSKGGNSYIEGCMEYIKEYERECREAGIIGFENTD